jgi:CHAD domain-containing protein
MERPPTATVSGQSSRVSGADAPDTAARYVIAEPLDPSAVPSLDLGPFHLRTLADERHRDVLLDTTDGRLSAGGRTLWLHDAEGPATLVLSHSAGNGNGSHAHESIEAQVPEDAGRDPQRWPPEIAAPVRALVGDADLAPVLAVEVLRHAWVVRRGKQAVGELTIADGTITATGKTEPVHELEILPRKGGSRTQLASLQERLCTLLPLQPEPQSQLERELASLRTVDPCGGELPLEQVAQHVLSRHVKKLKEHDPDVRAGRDSEAIHDMRTALRRLRSMLQVLEDTPIFDAQRLRRLRRGLRLLARRLGQARDLDVLLAHVQDYGEAHSELREGLEPLSTDLARRRERAQDKLLAELDRRCMSRRLHQLEQVAAHPPKQAGDQRPVLVRHFAGSAIWKRYEAVLSFEQEIAGAEPARLHQLRIACKRLRYTLELFADALGPGTEPLLKQLVAVQDHLGALQDDISALATIAHTAQAHPEASALAAYAGARAADRDQLRETFGSLWGDLAGAPFRQALAALIAIL